MKQLILLLIFCQSMLQACSQTEEAKEEAINFELTQDWKDYWYSGVAELTTYELQQARYGEMREGLATVVFVTEDFSKSRYVKLDYPEKAGNDKVSVLKFNLNKKFITGVYDYALMQSTFKPVELNKHPNTLRVTTSNIEWCGQFLTSARLKGDNYELDYNSYFDGEESAKLTLEKAILEDEIWNWIRIYPASLPVGEQKLIPSILTQELTHHELKVEKAVCELKKGEIESTYTINYPEIDRKLRIHFETTFPYQITGWEETFRTVEGWGMESKSMTTTAKKINTIRNDYWEKKYLKDEVLRKDLGIEE